MRLRGGGVGGARSARSPPSAPFGRSARARAPHFAPFGRIWDSLFMKFPSIIFWAPSVGVARALARRSSVWWGLFRATARLYVHSLVSSALSGGSPLSGACRLCARYASHSPRAPRSSQTRLLRASRSAIGGGYAPSFFFGYRLAHRPPIFVSHRSSFAFGSLYRGATRYSRCEPRAMGGRRGEGGKRTHTAPTSWVHTARSASAKLKKPKSDLTPP